MKKNFVFLTGLTGLFFLSPVFGGELRIDGLSWQDQLKDRTVFRSSLSNDTLHIVLDQEGGKNLSVSPVTPAIFKQKAKWKKLSALVRRGPDVMGQRLVLEDAAGNPQIYFCKNEKPAFHPLKGWDVKKGADLAVEKESGRMSVQLSLTRIETPAAEIILKPGQTTELAISGSDGNKWEMTLLRATRSLPSPAARNFSDEEAALIFDCVLARKP